MCLGNSFSVSIYCFSASANCHLDAKAEPRLFLNSNPKGAKLNVFLCP